MDGALAVRARGLSCLFPTAFFAVPSLISPFCHLCFYHSALYHLASFTPLSLNFAVFDPFLFTTSFLTTRRAPEQDDPRPLLAFASIAPHALAPQALLALDPRNTRYGVFTLDLSTASCACWLSDVLTPSPYSLVSTSTTLLTPQQTIDRGLPASTATAMEY